MTNQDQTNQILISTLLRLESNTRKRMGWFNAIFLGLGLAIFITFLTHGEIKQVSPYLLKIEKIELHYANKIANFINKKLSNRNLVKNPANQERTDLGNSINEPKLRQVHPHLVQIFNLAQQKTAFKITIKQAIRSKEDQKKYFESGASKTMNSRHLLKNGWVHALDLTKAKIYGKCVGKTKEAKKSCKNKQDWIWARKINIAMQSASKELQIPIEWGGYWKNFPDGFHWQLPWKSYPAKKRNRITRKKNAITLPRTQWEHYKKKMGCLESRTEKTYKDCLNGNKFGNYRAENKKGYLGKWQQGASSLCQSFLIKKTACLRMYECRNNTDAHCKKWKAIAKGKKGHKQFLAQKSNWRRLSKDAFLASEKEQNAAFYRYTIKNIALGGNRIKTGALAIKYAGAAHLGGHATANDFLDKGIDKKDGNGTPISYYFNTL